MSIESAKAFVEKLKIDEEWRNELDAVETNEEREAMAKAAGFDFTLDEFHKVRYELSDDELSAVAGGGSRCRQFWCKYNK